MRYLLPFLLCWICITGNKPYEETSNHPDHQFHKTDLTISRGQNLLAKSSPLTTYLLEGELSMRSITDMAMVPDSKTLFILSEDGHIIKLDSAGVPLFTIRLHDSKSQKQHWAYSLKVRNESLYVFDIKQGAISVYSLDGTFLRDIIPDVVYFSSFEVTPDGKIIIPNFYPSVHEGALFLVLNDKGEKTDQFGDNALLQEALEATNNITLSSLTLSPKGSLVLSLKVAGIFYRFDWQQQEWVSQFSIQGGPEWQASIKAEEDRRSYPVRIRDVCITSQGRVLVGSGGGFKDKISIGMTYNTKGEFMGRIFANDQLKYVPSQMVLVNDTTLWVFNTTTHQLFKTHLRPAHSR